MFYRVAVVKWGDSDGYAETIGNELANLGCTPVFFRFDQVIPEGVDVVFSFAPYGRLLQIPRQVTSIAAVRRPIWAHYSLESMPDPRIPWQLMGAIAGFRSWIDRLNDSASPHARWLLNRPPLSVFNQRLAKFRFVGEYYYAHRKGWMDVFAESSEIQARRYRQHGLPAIFVPWGTGRDWYADLNLERDIDVIWFGQRRNPRRSQLIDQTRDELTRRGFKMYIADNVENPFIFR